MNTLLHTLGIRHPLVLSPMAGVTTPALAAAVSNAGGLGSIALGAVDAAAGRAMIQALRQLTSHPFNVNLFCHAEPRRDASREAAWRAALAPSFELFAAKPPAALSSPYQTFCSDSAMLAMLLEERPPVISFHFGLPGADTIQALRRAGIVLMATATHLDEAQRIVDAGLHVIVAQGYEAGGHRGAFDPDQTDSRLGTVALVPILARHCTLPVIAAGGIMNGAGVAACLRLGASAAQLGTAFIGCPESSADEAHRVALRGPQGHRTVMTSVFSGRLARALPNRFTGLPLDERTTPDYPVAYHAGKALAAAAKARGETGFAAYWAGQGAPLARPMPAAKLMETLQSEMH